MDERAGSSTISEHLVTSLYKTNLTCTGIYTQQMHKLSSYMFRHSMGANIRQSSQWLQYCFRNGTLFIKMLKLDPYWGFEVAPLNDWYYTVKIVVPPVSLHGALRNISVTVFKHFYHFMSGSSGVLTEILIMCTWVTVLHTTDRFNSTTLTYVKTPWWWHPRNAEACGGGEILCICFACEVGFISWWSTCSSVCEVR